MRGIVDIECAGYTGAYASLNGRRQLRYHRYIDLARAMLAVGSRYKGLGVIHMGRQELEYRIGRVFATLPYTTISGGNLFLDANYFRRDPSERRVQTYWFGMAFTKLVTENLFSIPWLQYAEELMAVGALQLYYRTGRRPDLVGPDRQGSYHVFEAKGRSGYVESGLVAYAKSQATTVRSINESPPRTTSAVIVRLFDTPISIYLEDPQFEGIEEWEIDINEMLRSYYKPFVSFLESSTRNRISIQGIDFIWDEIRLADKWMRIGVPQQTLERVDYALELAGIFSEIREEYTSIENLPASLGLDGILVWGSSDLFGKLND